MLYLPAYQEILGCSNSDELFAYFRDNLNQSITYWNYFVNWQKVNYKFKLVEMDLHLLNYLVGKADVEAEMRHLLAQHPSVARLIPLLLAIRDRQHIRIFTNFLDSEYEYEDFRFGQQTQLTPDEIDQTVRFASQTGLLEQFKTGLIKNVSDYVMGIEVGLDSNGRKNRGGTAMETVIYDLLQKICQQHNFSLIKQATAKQIERDWQIKVEVDKASRRFDFAVKTVGSLYLIETNYYNGGGSKLKATAGEYRNLYSLLQPSGHKFIWITDGAGWHTAIRPLRETFDQIDYLFNLKMIAQGTLDYVLTHDL